jgi:cytochrome P450
MTIPTIDVKFYDPDVIRNPYPLLSELRATGPLLRQADGTYVVTTYAAVREVLVRASDFSSANANKRMWQGDQYAEAQAVLRGTCPVVPALLTADPPLHTRHRSIVRQAFSPRRVAVLDDAIGAMTQRLVDAIVSTGDTAELIAAYAGVLPMQMITEAVGAGRDDIDQVKRWSDAFLAHIGRDVPPEEAVGYAVQRVELQEYLQARIGESRSAPTDDLLGDIVRAEQLGDGLSVPEMICILEQLLVAGNETATKLITFTAHQLATDSELQKRARADRSLVPSLLEEMLRFETPVQMKFRHVTHDTELRGEELPAGSTVMVLYGSANRDADEFPSPDDVNPDRPNVRSHVAFGYGPHLCVGAQLARVEARIAIETLLDRFESIELDTDHPRPEVRASFVHRGFDSLHLKLR